MKILFLDDSKERQKVFQRNTIGHIVTFVSAADEAIERLEKFTFDQIWLDHDLEGEHTGREVSKYLAENADLHNKATVIVHTLNADGGKAICQDLWAGWGGYGKLWRKPFAWQDADFIAILTKENV
jgi:CheY-like chemotaxis protein